MYLLGYDIGSSAIKAALFDAATNETIAVVQYPDSDIDMISRQSGWAEQQPEVWWQDFIIATRKLLSTASINSFDIKGIGISYQMHGLVVVDKDYHVLRPSIIWCDSRAVEIGNKALDELGQTECFEKLLNSPGNFTASKLKWVKDNEPEIYDKTHRFMLPGDFIALRLTNNATTTIPGLSEGILWDFEKKEISEDLMKYYGFDEAMLPEITATLGIQGEVTNQAAEMTGLAAGTPVSFRAGDQPTNAVALNVIKPNEISATSGTSGVVYGVVDKPIYDVKSRVNSFANVNYESNDRIGVLLCLNGAGIQYSWMRHQVARNDRTYSDMERMVSTVPVGSDGLCILPFGNGAERMLENRNVNSHIFNIQFNRHNRGHLYRASLEGVAFSFVKGINILQEIGIDVGVMRVGNDNMFQSEVFATTIATLLDCHIEVVETTGAIGAARAAGVATGIYNSLEEALQGIKPHKIYEPKYNKTQCVQAYNYWNSCLEGALSPGTDNNVHESIREQLRGAEKSMISKEKELTTTNLRLQSKNNFLEEVKKEIKGLSKKESPEKQQLNRIVRKIEQHLSSDDSWKAFEKHFEMIHSDFFKSLHDRYPELSIEEIKLLSLLKMKITTKDIAQQLNLSVRGVETRRYRLRKKLNLPKKEGLDQFLETI